MDPSAEPGSLLPPVAATAMTEYPGSSDSELITDSAGIIGTLPCWPEHDSMSPPSSPAFSSGRAASPSTAPSSPPLTLSWPVSCFTPGQHLSVDDPEAEENKPFRRIPREVINQILDLILEEDPVHPGTSRRRSQVECRVKLAPYAVISRSWRYAVESHTYSHLYLTASRLAHPGARLDPDRRYHLRRIKFDVLFEPRRVDISAPPTKKPDLVFETLVAQYPGACKRGRNLADDWPVTDPASLPPRRPDHEQDERDRLVFIQSMHLFLSWLQEYLGCGADTFTGVDLNPPVQNLEIQIECLNGIAPEIIEGESKADRRKLESSHRTQYPAWFPSALARQEPIEHEFELPIHAWRFRKMEGYGLNPALFAACPGVGHPQFGIPPPIVPVVADMITSFQIFQTDCNGGEKAQHRSHGYVFELLAKLPHITKLKTTFYDHRSGSLMIRRARRNEFARDLARIPPQIKDIVISYHLESIQDDEAMVSLVDAGQDDPLSIAVRGLLRRVRHLKLENAIIGSELFWPRESGRVPLHLFGGASEDTGSGDNVNDDDAHEVLGDAPMLPYQSWEPTAELPPRPFSSVSRVWAPTPVNCNLHFPELETLEVSFPPVTPRGIYMVHPKTPMDSNTFLFNALFRSAAFLAQRAPRLRQMHLTATSDEISMCCPRLEYDVSVARRNSLVQSTSRSLDFRSLMPRKAKLEVSNFVPEREPTVLAWEAANVVHTTIYADEPEEMKGPRAEDAVGAELEASEAGAEITRTRISGPARLESVFKTVWEAGSMWFGGPNTEPPVLHAGVPPPAGLLGFQTAPLGFAGPGPLGS